MSSDRSSTMTISEAGRLWRSTLSSASWRYRPRSRQVMIAAIRPVVIRSGTVPAEEPAIDVSERPGDSPAHRRSQRRRISGDGRECMFQLANALVVLVAASGMGTLGGRGPLAKRLEFFSARGNRGF